MPEGASIRALESLEHLERLNRLNTLGLDARISKFKDRVQISQADYRDVPLLPGDVIYCDIPYQNTNARYCKDFDYEAFYAWACAQTAPVYISAYQMPEDRFETIAETTRCGHVSASNNAHYVTERIFVPKNKQKGNDRNEKT